MKNLNLQNTELYLVFLNNTREKEKISFSPQYSNLSKGEIVFNIDSIISSKVLKFTNKNFWIISKINNIENIIYQGIFDSSEFYSKWKNENEKIKNDLLIKKKELEFALEEAKKLKEELQKNNSTTVSNNKISIRDRSSLYTTSKNNFSIDIDKIINRNDLSLAETIISNEIKNNSLNSSDILPESIKENLILSKKTSDLDKEEKIISKNKN